MIQYLRVAAGWRKTSDSCRQAAADRSAGVFLFWEDMEMEWIYLLLAGLLA